MYLGLGISNTHLARQISNAELRALHRDLLKLFTTMELMRWSTLVEDYGMELRKGSSETPATDVFSSTEEGAKRKRLASHGPLQRHDPKDL